MHDRTRWIFVALAALLWVTPSAYAQMEQDVVIGAGLGLAEMDRIDEVRTAALYKPGTRAAATEAFVEWYPFARVGIGLRNLTFSQVEGVEFSDGTSADTIIGGSVLALMLHLVPWISDGGYARIGIALGGGTANYSVQRTIYTGQGNETIQNDWSTDGTAGLGQLYLDWGGDSFGARLGYGLLSTDLDDLYDPIGGETYKADFSNSHIFIDLRWAFG